MNRFGLIRIIIIASVFEIGLFCGIWGACTGASPNWTTTVDFPSVNTCVNNALDGDTVHILPGAATWSSTLAVSKSVNIIGAGPTSSFITWGAGSTLIDINMAANSGVRISGLSFDLITNMPPLYRQAVNVTGNGATQLRIDHNRINKGAASIMVSGWVRGVIDHNTFTNANMPVYVVGDDQKAWSRPIAAGTADALFIEDNSFLVDNGSEQKDPDAIVYVQEGASTVVRHNTVDASAFTSGSFHAFNHHGNQGYWTNSNQDFRGQPISEVYNNKMTYYYSYGQVNGFRGGSVLFFNNEFTQLHGTVALLSLREEECWQTPFFSSLRTTWPGQDQIYNTFIWNNTYNGQPSASIDTYDNCELSFLQQDRDYFLHAPAASGGKEVFTGTRNGGSQTPPTSNDIGSMVFSASGANAYYPYSPYIYPHPYSTDCVNYPLLCDAPATTPFGPTTIIPANRVSPWQGNVGVEGGIPQVSVIFKTLTSTNSLVDINGALASCPPGEVVQLAAGTYHLSGSIMINDRNGVVLRGAGRASTILVFASGGIDIEGSAKFYGPLANSSAPDGWANWTNGYTLGSSTITLSNTSGLSAGSILILDQLNDNDDVDANGGEGVCNYCGRGTGARSQIQISKVKAVNGNIVTLASPLFMPNWRSSQSPQAWWVNGNWISNVGIEDLTVDGTASGGLGPYGGNIYIYGGFNCWVKNVISKAPGQDRTHVLHYGGARCEVRHCDFIGTAGTSMSYALTPVWAFADWHEDNLVTGVTGSIVPGWSAGGIVNSYNFVVNNLRVDNPAWNQLAFNAHDAHANSWLLEGNYGNGYLGDFIHGSASFITLFRNRFHGRNPGTTMLTYPIVLQSKNRNVNFVGNVLGTPGYHDHYEDLLDNLSARENAIYLLGWSDGFSVGADQKVIDTIYRHGNYDTANQSVVWDPTNSNQTIPASFLYGSKPSWFGDRPWPPFDPASGASVAANSKAYTNIPAGYRYEYGQDPPGATNNPPTTPPTTPPTSPGGGTDVGETRFLSFANVFNPSQRSLSISLVVNGDGATLKVYDRRGSEIRNLDIPATGPALWDGKNSQGQTVASGTYLLVLKQGSKVLKKKVVAIK